MCLGSFNRIQTFTSENIELLQKAFDIRTTVFVDEQQVPEEEEIDDDDYSPSTYHYLLNHNDVPIGTARSLHSLDNCSAKIGRVAILKSHRNKGYGKYLIESILTNLKSMGIAMVSLAGQLQSLGFYHSVGFKEEGPVFLDAGIEHKMMFKALS
ncbi:hypothetical protein P9112_002293 [Eukaryota sp. TZLM1-RC]